MTQNELSFHANLDRSYISDIENGKRKVTIDAIDRIARALNIPVSLLFESKLFENPPHYQ